MTNLKKDEFIKKEVEIQFKDSFINESDNTDRFSIQLADRILVKEEEEEEEEREVLIGYIETYLQKNYKCVADIKNGNFECYYYKNSLNFHNIKDLFDYYEIDA